ncbi:MAG: DUF3107 domain-containing protein [Actinomycetota bacterium]
MIEVRIGIAEVAKELTIEVEESAEAVVDRVSAALGSESSLLLLTDKRGKRVAVPTARLAYVEIEPQGSSRAVGFGTA